MKTRSQVLASDGFLRSRDNPVKLRLLTSPDSSPDVGRVEVLEHRDGRILMGIANILKLEEPTQYKSLAGRYEVSKRSGARLLTLDEDLAGLLWDRIGLLLEHAIKDYGVSTTPLGFAVGGEWDLRGINHAVRVNLYKEDDDFFAPHLDTQYCPSGDERSLLSVVIYLTDDFDGGETVFYFPKAGSSSADSKGLTVEEEIASQGGLAAGYDPIVVKPKAGYAVVFSHNTLHEARPFRGGSGQRCLLRIDVLVRREQQPRGFAVSRAESPDYQLCLSLFREAQHQELKGNAKEAGELYERSLSIRFAYPRLLRGRKHEQIDEEKSLFGRSLMSSHESKTLSSVKVQSLRPWNGCAYARLGRSCWIKFDDAQFFKENVEGCCRAAAIVAFSQLGHQEETKMVTVAFNPVTQTVKAIGFDELVAAAFFNQPCYGAVFALDGVSKEEAEEQLEEAFANSVDRTYMMYRFGAQFVGKDFARNVHTHIKAEDSRYIHYNENDFTLPPSPVAVDGFEEATAPYRSPKYFSNDPTPFNRSFIERFCVSCESTKEFMRLVRTDEYTGSSQEFYAHAHTRDLNDDGPELVTRYFRGVTHPAAASTREMSTFVDASRPVSPCLCRYSRHYDLPIPTRFLNNMIVDFSRNELRVFPNDDIPETCLPGDDHTDSKDGDGDGGADPCRSCAMDRNLDQPFHRVNQDGAEVLKYRVDISALNDCDAFENFNHAGCNCWFPSVRLDMLECIKYTHLDHVHLRCCEDEEGAMFVMAIYGGIVAL
ncbi:hypothetical protein HDU96_000482 [Phlyctochytrium bullatum]|nr:hypothetical protein HDU96_000482 [Phlyctochytrium bullatum]